MAGADLARHSRKEVKGLTSAGTGEPAGNAIAITGNACKVAGAT